MLFCLFVLHLEILMQKTKLIKYEPADIVVNAPMSSFWQATVPSEAKSLKEVLPTQTNTVIFHGDRSKKQIALTFDADMTPGMKRLLESGKVETYYNKQVVDILQKTQTKATLFLTGMWIETYPDATKEFARNPLFELASHSYSHPGFDGTCYGLTPLADNQTIEEIQKTQEILLSFTGIHNTLFRFPGGCYSQQDVESVSTQGVRVIQWDVAGQDGFNNDPSTIENNVINQTRDGSIIVLHLHGGPNAPMTAHALPRIIVTLKERGYAFVTVSELLSSERNVSFNHPKSSLEEHLKISYMVGR